MEEVPKAPLGVTVVALPYVSKSGFFGATVQSLVTAILSRGLQMCKFLFLGDHTQVHARNMACKDAVEIGAEWLFFIDSDMDFPPDTLNRLKALDADIACTDMWSRGWPSFRTVMRFGPPDPATGLKPSVPLPDDATGVHDIDCCGMACTLIKVSMLRRWQEMHPDEPWFWTGKHGEDAMFCFAMKEHLGATIRADLDIVAGHWGVTRMIGQDYTRDAKNQPMSVSDAEMLRRNGVKNLPVKETV